VPNHRYDLDERLLSFAVRVSGVAAQFPRTIIGRHVAGQLVRAATSPAANYCEAQAAESRRDFVHKLRICLKELRETQFWLRFSERLELGASDGVGGVIGECHELIAILVASIRTATRRPSHSQ
jgi:four helix bundle protein